MPLIGRSSQRNDALRPATRRRSSKARAGIVLAAAVALLTSLLGATPAGAAPVTIAASDLAVASLTTNGRVDPLGIPGTAPTFGWAATAATRGVVQSAYELRVGTTPGASDVWATGKVASAQQVGVDYAGTALASQTRYYWQVRIWDATDAASDWSESAWFETGVLTAGEWSADWIGQPNPIDRWTDYTAEFDFTIVDFSFGAYVRAPSVNDGLMWQVSVADGTPRLRPHRKVGGAFTLLGNIDISAAVSLAQLTSQVNRLTVTVSPGTDASSVTVVTKINGAQIDSRVVTSASTLQHGYVGFRADNNNGPAEKFTVQRVKVTATTDGATLLDTDFSDGNPFDGGTVVDGSLAVNGPTNQFLWHAGTRLPLLRKEFTTAPGKTVTSARVYAAAHGVYELSINGEKVGDQYLAPGWTDYRTLIQHQTYDVTSLLTSGDNAIGGMLADGWWSGTLASFGTDHYGDSDALIAQLRIDYTDGTHDVIGTDDSWTTAPGPFTAADLIDGESYDARAENPGWKLAGYDDATWSPAVVEPATSTAVLAPQPDEPVRVTGHQHVLKRTEPTPGAFVYDLGQNMVGVVHVRLQGVAGQKVTLRYGEMLNPDGSLYTANLRSAKVTDTYTFATTGTVDYQPTFTSHGFRYLEITGATTGPTAEDVTGVVLGSDLTVTGSFETSDARLNQLQSNITWGQRGNFLSIPTDTPARDERLGWTGDINVFAPTAAFNQDTRAFLSKWLVDLRTTQRPNGDIASVAPEAPNMTFGGATGWSDAMITVPYSLFHAYDDTQAVAENFDAMRDYFEMIRAADDGALVKTRGGYLDWLHLDDPTPASVLSTAYFAEDARMLSEMAAAIGQTAYAAELATLSQDVRDAFTDRLVSADGTVSGNSQAGYALALGMNLVPQDLRPLLAAKLVAKIKAAGGHLTTGFLGTPWLLQALSGAGQTDAAYDLLMQDTMPSWLYEVASGATTMWERWDSLRPDGSFGDVSMNSFNHYAFGAVGSWMYQNITGLQALEPGYKKSLIAPLVDGSGLTHASGSLQTVYGTLSSAWEQTDDGLSLDIEVPVNTTAEVRVPASHVLQVTESGAPVADADGVRDVARSDGTVTLTVGSGTYHLEVHSSLAPLTTAIDAIAPVQQRVAEHADVGDLAAATRADLDGLLEGASTDLTDAIAASLAGDDARVSQRLQSAYVRVSTARTHLAAAGTTAPVRTDLDRRLAALQATLGSAVAWSHGITVALVPGGDALPGDAVTGTLQVASTGDVAATHLSAQVDVDGWTVDSSKAARDTLAAGESAQLPFSAFVPRTAVPGAVEARTTVSLTIAGEAITLASTSPWLTVGSVLAVSGITSSHVPGAEQAQVTVTVSNSGTAAASGQVWLTVPSGWAAPPPSGTVLVPAGGTATATVTVFVPRKVVGGAYAVTATLRQGGSTYATGTGSFVVNLSAPAAGAAIDYVDFGEGTSEAAHAVTGSASSGTNTEAGYTRRYSNSATPGSWYSAEVAVEPGKPFIGLVRETYDGARTKKYNVYVDDVLKDQLVVPRAESGAGALLHQFVIADPGAGAADGKVRIKFEFPADAAGFYDPSIADLWILPAGDDDVAPAVGAVPTSTQPGDDGWSQGPVSVSLHATDNLDPHPVIQVGTDDGWAAYTAPIEVSAQGETEVTYRAKDAAGNTSAPATTTVRIDRTSPTTQTSVGALTGSSRTVTFSAQDAHSGVAATYARADAGTWVEVGQQGLTVTGYGSHAVELYSVDVAGNVESRRSVQVDLVAPATPVEPGTVLKAAPQAKAAPSVTGATRPRIGATLTASAGTWSVGGLTLGYQWLRGSTVISGATAKQYRLTAADLGNRISVRVTALREGYRNGVSTSRPTAAVLAATSTTTVKTKTVRLGKKATITVTVRSAVRPTGKVTVTLRNKKTGKKISAKTSSLPADGTVRTRSPKLKKKGKVIVTVTYAGNRSVTKSKASTTLKVARR